MEVLPIILGLALIFGAVALAFFYNRRREQFKKCCRPTMARVLDVRQQEGSDRSWPDYRLTVGYTVGTEEYEGHISTSYWTLRSSFPQLLEPGARDERSSVPIVVDPERPKRIAMDTKRVFPVGVAQG